MELKGYDKRKILAMMLFNDADENLNEKLKKRKNKTMAVQNYMDIIDKYSKKDINKAKEILREGALKMMNKDWIFHKALHAKFPSNERQNQILFEKYMIQFRKELKLGAIKMTVDKDEVF